MIEGIAMHETVSAIYECACAENSWELALDATRKALAGTTSSLRVRQSGSQPRDYLTSVGSVRVACTQARTREWEQRKGRLDLDISCQVGAVRICRWSEMGRNSAIVDELRAMDVTETLFHCFAGQGRATYTLSVTRGENDPSFGEPDIALIRELGQHFRHALNLREKHVHGGLTGRYQAEALDQLGIAGILVDRFGAVLPLNRYAVDLLADGDCLRLSHNMLSAAFRGCNTELQTTLKRAFEHAGDEPASYALALERLSEKRPLGLVVHTTRAMCPLSNRMENCALVFARDPDVAFTTDPLLLQKLFSFTPAEANLAIGLAKGRPLKDIECSLNIRHNTARAHLRAMFIKADVARQAELVSLLTNSVAPLGWRQNGRVNAEYLEASAA